MYNFDNVIERRGTDSLKYDYAKERGIPESALPLWVADMDFQIPPEAKEALIKSAKHSIFGYTITKDDYNQVVIDWFAKHYSFQSKADWIVQVPGIVFALAQAVRAFTQVGEAVMIQRPVYYPFMSVITSNNRKLVDNPLVYHNGRYHIDFEDFERKIVDNDVRMFILCSPHNPVSRVWTIAELTEMAKICQRHNCIVVSDEIHCDITFPGHTHKMFPSIDNTVICTAPSKTFNLAGLQNANLFIANEDLRKRYLKELDCSGYSQLNTMGLVACKAVYEHGYNWLLELRKYLHDNFEFLKAYFNENIPKVKVIEPEGTYLIWLDFSAFGLHQNELDSILINQAGVWLSSGTSFGPQGEGFQRINIACPRNTLQDALNRIGGVAWN